MARATHVLPYYSNGILLQHCQSLSLYNATAEMRPTLDLLLIGRHALRSMAPWSFPLMEPFRDEAGTESTPGLYRQ